MTITYELIASTTVGSGGQANIEFTNIPQTFTDLVVFHSLRTTGSYTYTSTYFTVNNNTSNRSFKFFAGNGNNGIESSTNSVGLWTGYDIGANGSANFFTSNNIYISNYSGSNKKSFSAFGSGESNSTINASIGMGASLWDDTTAITSIKILPYSGNFAQYTTATLYGIKKD